MRLDARGPGVVAIGGAAAGDGDLDSAPGILKSAIDESNGKVESYCKSNRPAICLLFPASGGVRRVQGVQGPARGRYPNKD